MYTFTLRNTNNEGPKQRSMNEESTIEIEKELYGQSQTERDT